jgi:hypothetical protein
MADRGGAVSPSTELGRVVQITGAVTLACWIGLMVFALFVGCREWVCAVVKRRRRIRRIEQVRPLPSGEQLHVHVVDERRLFADLEAEIRADRERELRLLERQANLVWERSDEGLGD